MAQGANTNNIIQLRLPGMHSHSSTPKSATCCSVDVGQQVVYIGNVHGGPRFGSTGIITEALRRKAVVDMGNSGIWNIPYHFLTLPRAA